MIWIQFQVEAPEENKSRTKQLKVKEGKKESKKEVKKEVDDSDTAINPSLFESSPCVRTRETSIESFGLVPIKRSYSMDLESLHDDEIASRTDPSPVQKAIQPKPTTGPASRTRHITGRRPQQPPRKRVRRA